MEDGVVAGLGLGLGTGWRGGLSHALDPARIFGACGRNRYGEVEAVGGVVRGGWGVGQE